MPLERDDDARVAASNTGASGDVVPAAARPTWHEALFNRRMLICVFTGFSSGLPLWLLVNLLPAWLRTEGTDLRTIGVFTLVQAPYTW